MNSHSSIPTVPNAMMVLRVWTTGESYLTSGHGCGSLRSISHTLIQVLEGLSQSRPGVDEKQHPSPNGLGDSSVCPAFGDSSRVKTAVAVLCAALLTPRPPGDLDAMEAGLYDPKPMTVASHSHISLSMPKALSGDPLTGSDTSLFGDAISSLTFQEDHSSSRPMFITIL
jgi:hypothetical protein